MARPNNWKKSRLRVDISVQQDVLRCNIINSKNKNVPYSEKGIGIANVKKRLEFIYPGNYKLSLNDEGQFYVVSLLVNLSKAGRAEVHLHLRRIAEVKHLATPLSVYK